MPWPASATDDWLPITNILPIGLPPYIAPPEFSEDRAAFGRYLFTSKKLSRTNTHSCASCHIPQHAFSDRSIISRGIQAQLGTRNTPALANLYPINLVMHDGRSTVSQQPRLPLDNAREMHIDWQKTIQELATTKAGRTYCSKRNDCLITPDDIVESLSQFLSTLVSGNSRFDIYYYRKDDKALSQQQKRGLIVFSEKARCTSCHTISADYALFTDGSFHNIGIGYSNGKYRDLGRALITGRAEDKGQFRTPSLRNVALTAPYMHDGSLPSLRSVLDFYNKGGERSAPELDRKIKPLGLSEDELVAMEDFLGALSAPVQQLVRSNTSVPANMLKHQNTSPSQ